MTEQIIGGRFEIHDLLGQGGMATVYAGIDQRTQEKVAIKLLKPDIIAADPDIVERFDREGEALRRLNHPNIVKVLATVEENDQHYVVMEHVGGGDLRGFLESYRRKGQMVPIDRILEITLDLSDALTRAHRLKIVHRDIKPANVLMAEDGTPRLTDFGVAHFSDSTRMTQTGAIVGTLSYVSPEVCHGEEIDTRADIWAFGVMLYEMLTLSRPFNAPNTAALINSILIHDPDPIDELRPDAPLPLVNLVERMLLKDRDERINSVRLIGAQIEAIISGDDIPTSVENTPPPPTMSGKSNDIPSETPRIQSMTRKDWSSTGIRILDHNPRIFISYRRADSAAIVGRIYDRLKVAFGEEYIFKDVDNIPLGADFTRILDGEVGSCDVLLVIMGTQWATIDDGQGFMRLYDPEDFVRIEVEAGLRRQEVLVIPVLVNNAKMPIADELPDALHDLIHRNAAVVRHDPDFNRDIEWLVSQINKNFKIEKKDKYGFFKRMSLALFAAMVAIVLLMGTGLFLLLEAADYISGTQEPTSAPITIAPHAEDEYMVLVAQMEHVGGTEREVTRFVVEDLRSKLVEDPQFDSDVAIREYQAIITSSEQAVSIAEELDATVVVWGNYDDELVTVNVQLGSLTQFTDLYFERNEIENIANVQVRMTNERVQSMASPVLGVLNALHSYNIPTVFNMVKNLIILDLINLEEDEYPEIVGSSTGAQFHRFFVDFLDDPESSREAMTKAISLDSDNALLYLARSFVALRIGDFDNVLVDIQTAERWQPEWLMPEFNIVQYAIYFEADYQKALENADVVLATYPDNWWILMLRAMANIGLDNFEDAQSDLEHAMSFEPDVNFPYMLAMGLAIREGRFVDAQSYSRTILERFFDPDFGIRAMSVTYGDIENNWIVLSIKATGEMLIGQWNEVLATIDDMPDSGYEVYPDILIVQGVAHCNLGDYVAAETSYTRLLELDPDYHLAYALRAEVRQKQNDLMGALADVGAAIESPIAGNLGPYIPAFQSGELNCTNFLDADLEALASEVPDATPVPTEVTIPPIEPHAEDEYMVLIAQMEHVAGTERDVTRFIVDDLEAKLVDDVPFDSDIAIREYEGDITSEEQAAEIAEETGATIIIWGNYDDEFITIEMQLGSLVDFPDMPFTREEIEELTNVQVRMTNERRQSLVSPVVSLFNALHTYNIPSVFNMVKNLVILDLALPENPEYVGRSVAAYYYRFVTEFVHNPTTSKAAIDEAISLDSSNPLLYLARSFISLRLGEIANVEQDIRTSQGLPPEAWLIQELNFAQYLLYFELDFQQAIDNANLVLEVYPDSWWTLMIRTMANIGLKNYEAARNDTEYILKLEPDVNLPYMLAMGLAMRAGRFEDAQQIAAIILERFPDPDVGKRLMAVSFGEVNNNWQVLASGAAGELLLKQWNELINTTDQMPEIGYVIYPDILMMRGFAECNIEDYAAAEASYTRLLELDPDYHLAYALRAEVRQKQNNLVGALADVGAVMESPLGETLTPYMPAFQSGELNCTNFLDADLEALTNTG